ncbi:iron-containing alcohol dehydrogenase [Laccaria bicolor S238N-H82]|uniref:Iron-containing alcohol dehydrogenase n=1 Tax=Laccaria bicolor (strain S238N-H82 / ATCC MYA-4686) TaxID=486041 RepID=B0D879_LACBS|nr:iron-containing alcohol dehydrogenase [Laccaria bicolor S238N-H82]EDR08787.1 iron-containing alcohol dehydrogenase [Laccaria bicolor S238N-H82]|eukprot:XP_001880100.1 iron-containing alcohol dehydrogenase [Laccaria bicolor S238N-H82]
MSPEPGQQLIAKQDVYKSTNALLIAEPFFMSALDNTPALQGFYGWTDTLKGVYYGPGSVVTALPKLLNTLGVKKALIMTGKSLMNKTDVVRKVEGILRQHDAYGATFFEIGEHSPIAGIRNGIKAFQENSCDVIVSIGGGSPIDASKAILYNIQQQVGGLTPRQIAIPTTLSAAEYTIGAGFTNDEGQKVAVSSYELAPAGVILDAELTLATPERLWLSTGVRALDHAVENLYRPLVSQPVKFLCYGAIRDLFKYLPDSKANPTDVGVRQKLQLASWMSLWPMKQEKYSALGLSHSLGHKLGAKYGIPHGITSCLTLSPTVALQAEIASAEDRECLAEALFFLREPSTGSVEGDVRRLSTLINELVVSLGLQSSLTQYKVPKEDFNFIASAALGAQADSVRLEKVIQLLEGIYNPNKL